MHITQLKYRRGLGYPGPGMLPKYDASQLSTLDADWAVTFRKAETGRPDATIRKVSGITRLRPPADATTIALLWLESDSPLAPLLLWDVAHAAPVGAELHVIEDRAGERYFDRAYFKGGLVPVREGGGSVVYRKERALAAEGGSLDEWTFGIPTGPDDATLLNACVARILELDIPRKEIILCGRPGENFKYWDYVRIIGEDITAPPVQICKKKNRIAEAATYENLCIIHDRVFLPHNFGEMVRRFGDHFPLTAVQSLYFDDRHNFAVRRYSDACVGLRLQSHVTQGLARGEAAAPSRYAPAVLTKVEQTGFICANAHRYSPTMYPTGSLYLCKKSVWAMVPQDERLMWTEFEDIEQGDRAATLGIPSRINPYGVTQSMISRPILAWLGAAVCEKPAGGERTFRSFFEQLSWIPRKPLIKKTIAQAVRDHGRFMANWGVEPDPTIEPTTSAALDTKRRLRWMVQVVHAARIPLKRTRVVAFLKDFEKFVVSEQVPYGWHQATADAFANGGAHGLATLLGNCHELFNHAAQRPRGRVFARTLDDYFPSSKLSVFAGSVISAIFLARSNHRFMTLPPGVAWKLRAVLGSTPTRRYVQEMASPVGEVISGPEGKA